MLKARWLASACALGLLATPVLAAGPTDTSAAKQSTTAPGSSAGGSQAAASGAASGASGSTDSRNRMAKSGASHSKSARHGVSHGATSQDNVADQLNARVLQSLNGGQSPGVGGPGSPPPAASKP